MIIEATGLTKEFARARGGKRLFTAVHPLDIGLEERQLTLVSGHSGSGKSTLANMLAGILTPTAGTYDWTARTCTRCATRSSRACVMSASASSPRGTRPCEP